MPKAVAAALKGIGHDVMIQKDVIAPDASDPVVALASALNEAILVSFDKDHNALAHRHGIAHKQLKRLSVNNPIFTHNVV